MPTLSSTANSRARERMLALIVLMTLVTAISISNMTKP